MELGANETRQALLPWKGRLRKQPSVFSAFVRPDQPPPEGPDGSRLTPNPSTLRLNLAATDSAWQSLCEAFAAGRSRSVVELRRTFKTVATLAVQPCLGVSIPGAGEGRAHRDVSATHLQSPRTAASSIRPIPAGPRCAGGWRGLRELKPAHRPVWRASAVFQGDGAARLCVPRIETHSAAGDFRGRQRNPAGPFKEIANFGATIS